MGTQTFYAGFSGIWAHARVGRFPYRVHLPFQDKMTAP
jgi:hypothetical protein